MKTFFKTVEVKVIYDKSVLSFRVHLDLGALSNRLHCKHLHYIIIFIDSMYYY